MKFTKYHALGNDYLVLDPKDYDRPAALTAERIRTICDRHYGIGSDGVLFGPLPSAKASFSLRIFNPDGSEAEKSGNGLRIFSRFLWDKGDVSAEPFVVRTLGGNAECAVEDGGRNVKVDMGAISFDSTRIPVDGPPREVLREKITIGGVELEYSAATVGNPHCVLVRDKATEEEARRFGPALEVAPRFPNRAGR